MKTMTLLTRVALSAVLAFGALSVTTTAAHADDLTAKLQGAVAELSAEQQAALYLLLKQLQGGGTEAGAETAAAEASPEAAGAAIVNGFFEAAKAEDIEKMMELFSEDFDHYEYGDKQGIKDFLSSAIDMGYMDGIESSTEDAEYEVDGDEMTIYPVDVTGAFGSITFEYVLKKEGDAWKIIGFDAAGI